MIDVCLLGTGGMMPLPNRFLTSLLIRCQGHCILVDCGEATQIALKKHGWSAKPIDAICITHYHADHISGLPGLLLTMGNANRTETLTMIGPAGLEKVVNSLRIIAPRLPFDIKYIELHAAVEKMQLLGFMAGAFRVDHDMPCYGYSFQLDRPGRFIKENAERLGIPLKYWNRLQKGQTIESEEGVFTPDMVMGSERKGLKLTYCTDSRPCPSIIEAARSSDLFICEGMYGEPEMLEKAKEYKHMTFQEAAGLAKNAQVSELWLTHYSPSLVVPDEFLPLAKNIFANTKTARDGFTKTLKFHEDEEAQEAGAKTTQNPRSAG